MTASEVRDSPVRTQCSLLQRASCASCWAGSFSSCSGGTQDAANPPQQAGVCGRPVSGHALAARVSCDAFQQHRRELSGWEPLARQHCTKAHTSGSMLLRKRATGAASPPTCCKMVLFRGSMANTVQGHTTPSTSPAARQPCFSALLAALAAAIMAACDPRNASPPCSLAALQSHNMGVGGAAGHRPSSLCNQVQLTFCTCVGRRHSESWCRCGQLLASQQC